MVRNEDAQGHNYSKVENKRKKIYFLNGSLKNT